ncbi:MAG: PH domain-containing protein [Desulfuromonadales bacterium]|nr:PH domain-containing protein [Desulfuromonadales bacterium]
MLKKIRNNGVQAMGNYLQANLGQDENVVYSAKVSWSTMIPYAVIVVFILFLVINARFGSANKISDRAFYFLLIMSLLLLLPQIIRILTTELGLTNKRVFGKVGFISTDIMESPLDKINNVSLKIGLLDKMLNCGTVKVDTASGTYLFRTISSPNNFRVFIMNKVNQVNDDKMKKQAEEIARAMKQ